MKKNQGRSLAQMTLAANTPMMLKAGLVEGDTNAGVLASGQVVGVLDDQPTCDELISRVVSEAVECLQRSHSYICSTSTKRTGPDGVSIRAGRVLATKGTRLTSCHERAAHMPSPACKKQPNNQL